MYLISWFYFFPLDSMYRQSLIVNKQCNCKNIYKEDIQEVPCRLTQTTILKKILNIFTRENILFLCFTSAIWAWLF